MNRAPSRLALFSLMVFLSALLACSYVLHTVSVTNGRLEFNFTTCGTIFYGRPSEIGPITAKDARPVPARLAVTNTPV